MGAPTVTLNGVVFEFDWEDADTRQRYIDAANAYFQNMDALDKGAGEEQTPEEEIPYLRKACANTRTMLDAVFGEGAGEKVFQGKDNFRIAREAVDRLYDSIEEQARSVSDWVMLNAGRYAPPEA